MEAEGEGEATGFGSAPMEAEQRQCMQLQGNARAFVDLVGTNIDWKGADLKLIALKGIENVDHAAPESLKDAEINPGDLCAKFEDDSLLVWQQWRDGGYQVASF